MKKFINKLMILTAAFSIVTISACDDYLDINNDPTQVIDPDPNFSLTSAMVDIAYFHSDAYALAAGYWVQYLTQAGNVAGVAARDQYQVLPGDNAYQRDFYGLYSGPLQDLEYAMEEGTTRGQTNLVGVAMLLKAYAFQSLVDMFDRVPYSEAFNFLEFPEPSYEDGQAIYDDLIVQIDAAIALIDPRSIESVSGDIIFNGDMNRWLEFANTLKLKIYLRQTEARPSVAQAGVESLDGAAFLSGNAIVSYDNSNPSNRHPAEIADLRVQSFNAISGTFGNYLVGRNDPRANVYFRAPVDPNPTNPHQFIAQADGPNVTGTTAGLSFYSARGEFMIGTGSAFPYFSAGESQLLQAEGAARGWITSATAESLYNAAIAASYANVGLTPGAATLPYPVGGTLDAQLETIMIEKWVELIRNPIEMWNEWKRTGYPSTTPAVPVAGMPYIDPSSASLLPAGEFAHRFPPTQREIDLNSNTPEVVDLFTRVWWE